MAQVTGALLQIAPPSSPPAGERKGAGGKGRAARRAPQYQR